MIDQFLSSCDDVAPVRLRRLDRPASTDITQPRTDAAAQHRALAAGMVLVASVLGTAAAPGTSSTSTSSPDTGKERTV